MLFTLLNGIDYLELFTPLDETKVEVKYVEDPGNKSGYPLEKVYIC